MQLRLKLNHLYQGQNAPFLHVADSGLFAAAGLEVVFVEGFSSSQVTRALLEDEADCGFGDVTSVIEHAIRSQTTPIAAVQPVYVRSPCSLGYHRGEKPLALADLDGAVICGPKGDTSARLLPALLALNGLEGISYEFLTVSPEERDQLVADGKVLAATCFDATLKFAMRMRGHDSSDIDFLYFADHGLDAYSSAFVCLRSILEARPGLGKTLAGIVQQAWEECRDDPERGVRAVMARNGKLDPAIVREQLQWVLDHQVFAPTQPPFTFLTDSQRWRNTLTIAEYGATGSWWLSPATEAVARTICSLD